MASILKVPSGQILFTFYFLHHSHNAPQNASGKNAPRYNPHPKLPVHRQDNWRVAFEFMKSIGINAKGIEPAGKQLGFLWEMQLHLCVPCPRPGQWL